MSERLGVRFLQQATPKNFNFSRGNRPDAGNRKVERWNEKRQGFPIMDNPKNGPKLRHSRTLGMNGADVGYAMQRPSTWFPAHSTMTRKMQRVGNTVYGD